MTNSKIILLSRQIPKWLKRSGLLCAVLLTALSSLMAQGHLGGANGTVTDSTGAVVPGATVRLTNVDTGVSSNTVTSSAGGFTFINLIPGKYTVSIKATGFKQFTQTGLNIDVGASATVFAKLIPGSADQTVTVSAQAVALETASPGPGTTVDRKLLQLIPIQLNGSAGFQNILAAVFSVTPGAYTPPIGAGKSNTQIGAGQNGVTFIYYNGLPQAEGGTGVMPPLDFVSEARVDRTTFDAQWGWSAGDIQLQTISGTNNFHGDAQYINRNSSFDSKGIGNQNGNVNHANDFGFTIGGPVWLPKLYNGHDRTFFTFTFSRFLNDKVYAGYATVPTLAMKNGDFSGLYTTNKSGAAVLAPIYDPLSPNPLSPTQFSYNGVANVIPPGRISATSQSILKYIPDPNSPGTGPGNLAQNYHYSQTFPFPVTQWGVSLDEHLTPKQILNFSLFRFVEKIYQVPGSGQLIFGPPNAANPLNNYYLQTYPQWQESINYTNQSRPNLVMTAGIGMMTNDSSYKNVAPVMTIPAQNLAAAPAKAFPGVSFSGIDAPVALGRSGGYNGNLAINQPSFYNNWQWTLGRHILNIGGQGVEVHWGSYACSACVGTFGFSGNTTTDNISSTRTTTFTPDPYAGSPFASFLLGEADSASLSYSPPHAIDWGEYALYIQDNMKVNTNLTVNAGLRWDIQVPSHINNNLEDFVTPTSLTVANPAASGQLGSLTKYGTCADCAGFTRADVHWKEFGPRVGFSYEINPNTVVSSGFSLIWIAANYGGYQPDGTAFGASSAFASGGTNSPSFGSWDTNTLNFPPPAVFSPSSLAGQTVSFIDRRKGGMNPYVETWTLSIQRELPWDLYFRGDYVGELGIHQVMPLANQLNNIPEGAPQQYRSLLSQKANSAAAQAAGIQIPFANFAQLLGNNATVMQALRPYPQYLSIRNTYPYRATNNYQSLQMELNKRYSNGLFFLFSTTLQRLIGTSSSTSAITEINTAQIDPYNEKPESVVETPPYSISFSGSYELPFGPGKRFANINGIAGELLGGWQLAGVATYIGGIPYGVIASGSPYGYGNRANRNSDIPIKINSWSSVKDWIKGGMTGPYPTIIQQNGAFTDPGQYAPGNSLAVYSSLRGPAMRNENVSLYKNFAVTEHVKAILRVDYFNAFNRWTLLNQTPISTTNCVVNNVTSGSFGQVTGLCGSGQRQGQASLRIEF